MHPLRFFRFGNGKAVLLARKMEIVNTLFNQLGADHWFTLRKPCEQGMIADNVDQSGGALTHAVDDSNGFFGKNIEVPGSRMA